MFAQHTQPKGALLGYQKRFFGQRAIHARPDATGTLVYGGMGRGLYEISLNHARQAIEDGDGLTCFIDGFEQSQYAKIYSMAKAQGREQQVRLINLQTGLPDPEKSTNTFNPLQDFNSKQAARWMGEVFGQKELFAALMPVLVARRNEGRLRLDLQLVRNLLNDWPAFKEVATQRAELIEFVSQLNSREMLAKVATDFNAKVDPYLNEFGHVFNAGVDGDVRGGILPCFMREQILVVASDRFMEPGISQVFNAVMLALNIGGIWVTRNGGIDRHALVMLNVAPYMNADWLEMIQLHRDMGFPYTMISFDWFLYDGQREAPHRQAADLCDTWIILGQDSWTSAYLSLHKQCRRHGLPNLWTPEDLLNLDIGEALVLSPGIAARLKLPYQRLKLEDEIRLNRVELSPAA